MEAGMTLSALYFVSERTVRLVDSFADRDYLGRSKC